jgi:hypothetical protein
MVAGVGQDGERMRGGWSEFLCVRPGPSDLGSAAFGRGSGPRQSSHSRGLRSPLRRVNMTLLRHLCCCGTCLSCHFFQQHLALALSRHAPKPKPASGSTVVPHIIPRSGPAFSRLRLAAGIKPCSLFPRPPRSGSSPRDAVNCGPLPTVTSTVCTKTVSKKHTLTRA